MRFIFALFIIIPIIEIAVFIQAGSWLGTGTTLLLILVTAVIGVTLIRQQGIETLFRAQQKMQSGEVPAIEMIEGFLLAIAGVLLITPGFFTDSIGFLLLIPPLRKLWILRMGNITAGQQSQTYYTESSRTIEGEFKQKDED